MNNLAQTERTGDVYGLICTCHPETGIQYVGQTVSGIRNRRDQHVSDAFGRGRNLPIHNWIKKHAAENRSNIAVVLIEAAIPVPLLDEREVYWIAFHDTLAPNGKNVTIGGGGQRGNTRPHTPEERLHMSQIMKGRKPPQSAVDAVSKMMQGMTGESNYNSKLNDYLVAEIIDSIFHGVSPMRIAFDLGIDHTTVYQIRNNRTWLHIPRPIGPKPRVEHFKASSLR